MATTNDARRAYAQLREEHGLDPELSPSVVAKLVRLFGQEPEVAASARTTTNTLRTATRVGGPFGDHPTASAS